MANINLLPWRAELRKQRQNEFIAIIGLVVGAAVFVLYLISSYYGGAIDDQNARNNYLMSETKVLDAKIAEISKLRETRQKLVERMELIQALQGNRPIIVRVFDEMVRQVPDDLYFTSVEVKGTQVRIKGVAKSNSRVSALMRNFDQSLWFAEPGLVRVQAKGEGVNEFEVTLKRVQPATDGE